MRFIEVTNIPKQVRSCKHKLEREILDFIGMDVKTAKVEYSQYEYSCVESLRACLKTACVRVGVPVDVKMVNGEVYLVRRDR